MRAVIWGIVAFVFVAGNFILDLATIAPGSRSTAAIAGAVGYAAGPCVLAAILLFSKKYRYATFFKAAAWISGLLFVGTLVNFGAKLGEPRRASTQLSQQQRVERDFIKAAEQMNEQNPVMVSENIRMDRVVAGPGARLTYFYSIPKHSSNDYDHNEFLANIKPGLKEEVCADKDMKFVLGYGAVYVYSYSGNDGVEIARVEVSKDDCSN